MIATMEYVSILDRAEQLGEIILQSDIMNEYKKAHYSLNESDKAQELIKAFINIKDHYEDVQRFGRYHPDYNEIMRNVRSTKREMDMNDQVAKFKIAERNLQRLLDEISEHIALSVSEEIKVPIEGGALGAGGCSSGGGCGSGGSCSCQAS